MITQQQITDRCNAAKELFNLLESEGVSNKDAAEKLNVSAAYVSIMLTKPEILRHETIRMHTNRLKTTLDTGITTYHARIGHGLHRNASAVLVESQINEVFEENDMVKTSFEMAIGLATKNRDSLKKAYKKVKNRVKVNESVKLSKMKDYVEAEKALQSLVDGLNKYLKK